MEKQDPQKFWALVYRLLTDANLAPIFRIGVIIIGCATLFLLYMALLQGLPGILTWSRDTSNYMPARRCLDLKEIKGEIYKIDQCKGTIEPLSTPKKAQPR